MSADDSRPNIILITTDQQRYDTLGVTGNPMVRTPELDALAGRGVLFRRAYIQNPVCVPSRACIQTGRYVHQHGVEFMCSEIDRTPGLPPWETTMMEHLQRSGYATAAFGKIHMMPPRGFDELQLTMGKGARWTSSTGSPYGPAQLGPVYADWLEQRNAGGYERVYAARRTPQYRDHVMAVPTPLPADQYVDGWIGRNVADYVSRDHDTPFFVWAGFCGPHTPFDPPEPYASLYDQDAIELPERFRRTSPSPLVGGRNQRFAGADGEAALRRVIAYYWAMVTYIDDMVGSIVASAEQRNDGRDTVIIFTTDHGEMLGDFGTLGKANFTESVIRAPLLVVPSLRAARSARTVDDLVEHVDLAPTILDVAGVARPPEMPGRSLRHHWDPAPGVPGTEARDSVLCEYTSNDRQRRSTCLRTERHKYVVHDFAPAEFYDLHDDPHELTNLADSGRREPLVREHAERLVQRLTATAVNGWNAVPAARAPSSIDDFGRPLMQRG